MAKEVTVRVYNIGGINTYTNPFLHKDGEPITCVNMVSDPYGAKTKRTGYSTFLGTPDTAQVNSLFSWTNDSGSLTLYRASGSALYYSVGGTGAWTLPSNGTISNGARVGHAVLNNTLILGDGVGSTRHSTSGTAFTNTNLAPIASSFEQYQGRIYTNGTASYGFYGVTNDATNWNTSGTSDSSSLLIPGAGTVQSVFKSADKLIYTKSSGQMYKWDGYNLVDMTTLQGPSSPYSIAQKEGLRVWVNRDGYYGYGGNNPELISNPIETQIYNRDGDAIVGTVFNTAPAETHRYDYYSAVGTVTDGFTDRTITNCVQKYDFKKNEWLNLSMGVNPTAFHSYTDANGVRQMIFGDANGQCYQLSGTTYADNGGAIASEIMFMLDANIPEDDKLWRWLTVYTNPGCQAKCQVAVADTFQKDFLKWVEIGDMSSGATEYRFPTESSRGKLLFIRIYESSRDTPFTLYGFSVQGITEEAK